MRVRVKVYDKCKYEADSIKLTELEYQIESFEIVNREKVVEIYERYNEYDEYDEYLVLYPVADAVMVFKNSHVDMFRA